MKKTILFSILSVLFFASCNEKPKQTTAVKVQEQVNETPKIINGVYKVNTEKSVLNWEAKQISGGHTGIFPVAKGLLEVNNENVIKGSFEFDIKKLEVTDIPKDDHDYEEIYNHLIDPDFFEADKFPKANFHITDFSNGMITGKLVMRGIENEISFPAKIKKDNAQLILKSEEFYIDRTLWKIGPKSEKLFSLTELMDSTIKDKVKIQFQVYLI
ncbi:YceI family protein [Aureivirga marina]|uniref:YceI family protein n=1 Tax=Aureivirga marina TaxID=1182451 RepID=UPI0018CAAC29|nr:YceI family protein [Aureivirga marina]